MNGDAPAMAAHAAEDRPSPRTPWIVWVGLGVVLLAAAALSFEALTDLALAVGIRPALAWLLPVVVDAGAAVSTGVWLGRGSPTDAARFAGRMTVGLLVVTVAGNAGQLAMAAYGLVPPWYVAAIVGMVPPAVVWSGVHLVVMLVRGLAPAGASLETEPATLAPPLVTSEDEDPMITRARELVAAGAGRGTLAKELAIPEHQARTILEKVRTNGHPVLA